MSDLPHLARRAERSPWFERLVRFGFLAYGVVYLIVALLAFRLAFGDGGGQASSSGAVHTIAAQPFGRVLLWLIALGMVVLVLWRLVDAFEEQQGADEASDYASAAFSVGKAVLYGAVALTAAQTAAGSGQSSGGGGSSGTDGVTASLLDLPGGRILVGLVALAIIGYGCWLGYYAWTERFRKHLDAEGTSGHTGRAYLTFGKVGYLAKGVVAVAVGALFGYAALTHDAQKSGGVDQALHQLLGQPFGPVLVTLLAAGLACYGLFCFARARHLQT